MAPSHTPPWWDPAVFKARKPFLEGRARVMAAFRAWFDGQGFTGVETPALQVTPCMDVHIHGLETAIMDPAGNRKAAFLHTSPEFPMKKLLVAGMERIYQICHVYRNGEGSRLHSVEFTMLEWYRAGGRFADLIADCTSLLRTAAHAGGRAVFHDRDVSCDPFAQPLVITCRDALAEYAGIDLDSCLGDRAALSAQLKRLNIHHTDDDAWDDLFLRVMMDRVEPHLGHGRPAFITHYPAQLAMLARRDDADPRYSMRFELYACGIELANAYEELTDAAEQEARFRADMAEKKARYGFDYPVDDDFIAALRHGMPESAGIALGVDRLVMLATGASNIEQVLWAGKP